MADQSRSIRKDLFGSTFKTVPPNKNDTVQYPEIKDTPTKTSANADSTEANNGQNMPPKGMEANNS